MTQEEFNELQVGDTIYPVGDSDGSEPHKVAEKRQYADLTFYLVETPNLTLPDACLMASIAGEWNKTPI